MNESNMPGINANNNVQQPNGPQVRQVQVSSVIWRTASGAVEIAFRMYLTVLVVIYQWCVQLLGKLLAPLQPALDQVQKVPKQDVSLQGILYQYVRLLFLLVLYFTPWAVRAGAWILEPLRKLRDWAVDYVEGPWGNETAAGKSPRTERES